MMALESRNFCRPSRDLQNVVVIFHQPRKPFGAGPFSNTMQNFAEMADTDALDFARLSWGYGRFITLGQACARTQDKS